MQLGPLADGELAAVVCSVAPLAEDDVRRAVAAAEGNPLLAVESALSAPDCSSDRVRSPVRCYVCSESD
ncbi:MAG: hypothetical protein ACRDRG_16855 [Pseudonocardiaceae bacterium]